MMKTEQLCFRCMSYLHEPGSVCPVCGYDNRIRTNDGGYLGDVVLQGQYYIGKALGRGGFGITYMAMDLYLERVVAVKEYFPINMAARDAGSCSMRTYSGSEADYQQGCRRAMEEGRMVARIGHVPGVVQVHNVFQANNTVYIVMEYVGGMTLANLVRCFGGRMPWQTLYALMEPLMQSLHTIHGMRIIHRDVSPDNIMIRNVDGTAVLLDFGAAHNVSDDAASEHSVSLRIGYAPAEQYSRIGVQDGRIDEYALCATMYYALTGTKPPDATERLYAGTPLRSLTSYGVPPAMEAVLHKGMAVRADDRYVSMAALRSAFLQFQQPEPEVLQMVLPVVRGERVYPMLQPLPESRPGVSGSVPRTGGEDSVYTQRNLCSVQSGYVSQPAATAPRAEQQTMQAPPEALKPVSTESVPRGAKKKSKARVIVPIAATAAAAAVAVGMMYLKPGQVEPSQPTATVTITADPTAEPTGTVTVMPTIDPAEAMTEGDLKEADGIVYRMLADGTVEVSSWGMDSVVAVVPDEVWGRKVSGVGTEAFAGRETLTGVALGGNVSYIGDGAFMDCGSMVNIALPDTLRSIGASSFARCASLARVYLPEGFENIGEQAFAGCENLTYVYVPESVSYIAPGSFDGCGQLVLDAAPGSYAEQYAREYGIPLLESAELVETPVPDPAYTIQVRRQGGCNIVKYEGYVEELILPAEIDGHQVAGIIAEAFAGHDELVRVELPEGLESIKNRAFADCANLAEVKIPASVTSISMAVFANSDNVVLHVEAASAAEAYAERLGMPYEVTGAAETEAAAIELHEGGFHAQMQENATLLLTGYDGGEQEFEVPWEIDGYPVTAIGGGCFAGQEQIVSVGLPESVTEIYRDAFAECVNLDSVNVRSESMTIWDSAFAHCDNLTYINLPDQLTLMDNAFTHSANLVVEVKPGSDADNILQEQGYQTGVYTFKEKDGGCVVTDYDGAQRDMVIPQKLGGLPVKEIGQKALRKNESMETLTLPEGLEMIGCMAFESCGSLRTVVVPDTVSFIDFFAFRGCGSLTEVYLPGSINRSMIGVLDACPNVTVYAPEGSMALEYAREQGLNYVVQDESAFTYGFDEYGCYIISVSSAGDTLVVPAAVDGNPIYAIGYGAFQGNEDIRHVVIEDGITVLGAMVLADCPNLETVTLPESMQLLGGNAIFNCPSLRSVNLPSGLTRVVSGNFEGCGQLTLSVTEQSVGLAYAKANDLPYEIK